MEHVSAAHAQLLQVARALAFDCRVLVLDEPTTSLTDAEVDHLFRVLRELKARGVTLLYVSHRLPEVFRLCDRITVLRDGAFVGTFDAPTTTPDDDRAGDGRARAAARASSARPPARRAAPRAVGSRPHASRRGSRTSRSTSARARSSASSASSAPDAPSCSKRSSAWRSQTPGAMADRRRSRSRSRSPRDAARAGIALVPEERQRQGLLFNLDAPPQPRAAAGGEDRRRAGFDDGRGDAAARDAGVATGASRRRRIDALARHAERRQPAEGRRRASGWRPRRACCCSTSRRRASTSARSSRSTTSSARTRPAGWRAWWCRAICRRCWRWPIASSSCARGACEGELDAARRDRGSRHAAGDARSRGVAHEDDAWRAREFSTVAILVARGAVLHLVPLAGGRAARIRSSTPATCC